MNDTNNPNPAPNPPADPPADPPVVDKVDKSVHESVKSDLFKQKEENRKLKEQLENQKISGMKEKEDWKGIAEAKTTEAEEYKTKYSGLAQSLSRNAKMSAINSAALKAGIVDQSLSDLEMLDFDEVRVESTDSGKFIVTGAEQAIENLKKRRPHWFGSKATPINPTSPETLTPSSGRVTLQDLEKLRVAYEKNPQDSVARTAYESGIIAFKTQK